MSRVIRSLHILALFASTLFCLATRAEAQTIEGGPGYVAFSSCPNVWAGNHQFPQVWVMSTNIGNDAVQLGPNLVLHNNQLLAGLPVGVLVDTVTDQVIIAWGNCVFIIQYEDIYEPM